MIHAFRNTPPTTPAFRGTAAQNGSGAHAVEAHGLTVLYGRVPALCDVDLVVGEGDTIAVMGPNGAGKSTLLKCFVGVVRPAAGEVRWFGRLTARRDCVCRQIGYVGQDRGLYAELTAAENLIFAGRMHGVANVRDRTNELLAGAGLDSLAQRPVGELSQGMRQRLAIARALVHDPRLLVLDEPSSSLDAAGRQWLEQLFEQWRDEGRTVCLASHDEALSRKLANRLVLLNAGRIEAIEKVGCPPGQLRWSA